MTDLHTRFKAILAQHVGMSQAIQVKDLADALGIHERLVRRLKRELVDEGMMIGSSCDAAMPGYYMLDSPEEIALTVGNYKARLMSLAQLIRATEGAAKFQQFLGQLNLKLEGK